MNALKPKFATFGLISVSVIACIVILELMSGCIYRNLQPNYDNGKRLVEIYRGEEPIVPKSIEEHPYLVYQNSSNYQAARFSQHNSKGYRGKGFDAIKAPSTTRILALGCSTTYMYPYIKNPDNIWVAQLRTLLDNNIKSSNVEIVNAGLSYATSAELLSSYVFRHEYLNSRLSRIHATIGLVTI